MSDASAQRDPAWDPVSWTPVAASEPTRHSRFVPVEGAAPIALCNPASCKWTKQSSVAEPYGNGRFARPTQFERAPYWTIDLAGSFAVEHVRLQLAPLPENARVRLVTYAYSAVDGAPPHNAPTLDLRPSDLVRDERGVVSISIPVDFVARFIRVELCFDPPNDSLLSLEVRGLSLDATDLYGETLRDSYARAFTRFADRTLFSQRRSPGQGPFVPSCTYRELWTSSRKLARALARRLERGDDRRIFLGVIIGQRPEWFAAELAAVHRGYVMVPIAPDDSDERLRAILQRCPLDVAICDRASLARLRAIDDAPRWLICVDDLDDPSFALPFRTLIEEPDAPVPEPVLRGPNDLHTVIFTSGSTGVPKGAMRSYARFNLVIASYGAGQPAFHLSFQPLSHLSERNYLPAAVLNGAHVGLCSGPSHVLSDIEAFEPTWVSSVPRLFEAVHAIYAQQLERAMTERGSQSESAVEARVLRETRAKFGRRLQGVAVGSAPVSDELFRFLQRLFAGLWVHNGYGSTEVGTITANELPVANAEMKIVPVQDDSISESTGESTGDRPVRGELWVRTAHLIDGYFNDPEANAKSFDAEGYFCTGDLVERTSDGRVRVVGRRSNSVKLASGEFVALDRIEAVLAGSSLVHSVFVALDRARSALVAVVVPHVEALRSLLNTGADEPLTSLVARPEAAAALLAHLREHGLAAGLLRWECPSAVLLDHQPFTVESGLLTTSQKLARRAAEARYRAAIDAMSSTDATLASPSDGSLAARVLAAVSSVAARPVTLDEPLHEGLARDSLVSAELVATVGVALGRELSLREWSDARSLRALIERDRSSSQLEAMTRDLAIELPAAFAGETTGNSQVLLTGATGLIGAHALESLVRERAAHVRCFVRAATEEQARSRVEATLARYAITGLDPARWSASPELPSSAEAIVHCAAAVNWLATYEAVRASNVELTRAVLALAAQRGAELQFVSTVSTAPSDGDEASFLSIERAAMQSGYGASKWVAESLVRRAIERGLRACVHRPGLVTGHSSRGLGNRDDFVHRYLLACARYGVALDSDRALDMTPVDYVGRAIARSLGDAESYGRVVHLNNVRGAKSFRALAEAMRRLGLACALVGYEEFRARAVQPAGSPLRALSSYFTSAGFYLGSGPWPDGASRAWLAARGVECPAIDDAVLRAYLQGMKLIA
ncbi:MAG: AMP-binding protein [Polyangiales bacterium]